MTEVIDDAIATATVVDEARTPPRRRGVTPALGLALLVAACVLPLFRQEGTPSWDTVWAEDGAAFVQSANAAPVLDRLLLDLNGYSQLIGRIQVAPTRYLPVEWIAPYLAVSASVVAALLALFVYRAAGSHIRSPHLRLALAAACVLHPALLAENTATVVNLLWLFLYAAFWAVVTAQQRWYDVVARSAVVFLAVTSTPLVAAYLPVLLWMCWRRRRRSELVVGAAFVAGGIIQMGVMLLADGADRWAPSSVGHLVVLYPVRVVGTTLVGERPVRWLWLHLGVGLVILCAIAAVAVAGPGIRAAGTPARRFALVASVLSVVLFCIPLYMRGTEMMELTEGSFNAIRGGRYVVVPALLLLTALAVLYDEPARRQPRIAMAFTAAVALILVAGFRDDVARRSVGPSWETGVDQAQQACAEPDSDLESTWIPTSPGYPWATVLPCDRLLNP